MMPKQGQSVESCIISQWFRKKGDSVKVGDPLFSYETDKASFEEEAKTDGILLEIFYGEGEEVPVLYNVAVIGQVGELIEEFRSGGSVLPAATQMSPSVLPEKEVTVSVTVPSAIVSVEPVLPPSHLPSVTSADAKIRVSPRARAIAKKKDINLAAVKGSGPNGRIIAQDLLGFENPAGLVPEIDLPDLKNPTGLAEFDVKKLTNVRKLIAKAMFESLQNSAQLTHHLSADVRKMLAFREEVKKAQKSDPNYPNITINDMVCWAVTRALEKFPEINSHFLGDSIRTFKKVHLALAVDTPRGLMVPVLKNADDLSLKGLSNKLYVLADACRKGNIDPDLLQSTAGTFTVSNLGNYGVEMFTPIINLPQVAILGVNTIVQRPADIGGGIIAFVPHIGLSLTYDHRAVDGGPATLFLKEIKTQIENFNCHA